MADYGVYSKYFNIPIGIPVVDTEDISISIPDINHVAFYAKPDGKFYKKTPDGVESVIESGTSGSGIIDITYEDLVLKIGASELNPGSLYKITDFATKHYILDGLVATTDINTGINEPLIVLAISVNTLDKVAYSLLYPQDIIHYDWNPDNWTNDIGFSLDGYIIDGFKGVIYFRHDTKNDNLMGYDFRNVKFRRWKTVDSSGKFDFTDTNIWANQYQSPSSDHGYTVDILDYIDVLTFNCPGGEVQYENEVFSNHFECFRDNTQIYYNMPSILENNVFHLINGYGSYQVIGNEFGISMCVNTFNGNSESNIVGNHFYGNTIGNEFGYNTVENNFYENTIGNEFGYNTIGNDFGYNTIGNNFGSNTIGNYFSSNTIVNDFYENTIGNNFYENTIGNDFGYNTIGNNFGSNTIGNNFGSNTIGNYFSSNTIGNYFSSNTIQNSIFYIKTNDGDGSNTDFQYNTIKDGVHGSDINNLLQLNQSEYYEFHNTETYIRPDGTVRLMYYDNSDALVIKSPSI